MNYLINDGERLNLGVPVANIKTPDLNTAAGQKEELGAVYSRGRGFLSPFRWL